MKLYHGTFKKDFSPSEAIGSRYGFPVLFFTDNFNLAEKFAQYHKKKNGAGFIYEVTINAISNTHDYKSELAYNGMYKSMIHKNFHLGKKSLFIKNVIDRPSADFPCYDVSNIAVIYDFNEIKKIELLSKL